jgi:hypothetical protein
LSVLSGAVAKIAAGTIDQLNLAGTLDAGKGVVIGGGSGHGKTIGQLFSAGSYRSANFTLSADRHGGTVIGLHS